MKNSMCLHIKYYNYSYSFKVTQVHRKIITEEKVAVAKKDEAPPKRGILFLRAT